MVSAFKVWLISHLPSPISHQTANYIILLIPLDLRDPAPCLLLKLIWHSEPLSPYFLSSLLESLIMNVDGKDVVPALHKRPTQVPLHNHTLDGSFMVLHREKTPRNGRCKALHRSHYRGKLDRLLRPWSLRRSLLKGS